MFKTNVMRVLDARKIAYKSYEYTPDATRTGGDIARLLGQDAAHVYKTLITTGASRAHYAFMVPVEKELDLKKAAKAAGEKSVEMLKAKELLPLTGYVHGGCSPIGLKKALRTFIHLSAEEQATIVFSAGKVGYQVEAPLEDVRKVTPVETADLVIDV